jgi:hypothetical protein
VCVFLPSRKGEYATSEGALSSLYVAAWLPARFVVTYKPRGLHGQLPIKN